jgi:hypothetical protein
MARVVRMLVTIALLALALVWVWRTNILPERVSMFVTAVIGAVTAVYALFTYEILLQNQAMAQAALDSSVLMERSLRFSHTAKLLYETIITKDPTRAGLHGSITPIENDDYRRALAEFNREGEQKEFVFAVLNNKGQGAATNITLDATYQIVDSSNPNRESTISKHASIPLLEPNKGVALCIFISKVPTSDDRVSLLSAHMVAGDFYRDAIDEPAQEIDIDPRSHQTQHAADCVVRLT